MKADQGKKDARSERVSFRATEKTVGQLAELQRVLGSRLGSPVSQGQAIAAAVDALLDKLMSNPGQGRLI